MNLMEVDGYRARLAYDSEIDQFRGEILGLSGGADFYGKTPAELRKEFRRSLKAYLKVCEEKGIAPLKTYSGKFNLRIPSALHGRIAEAAAGENKSINEWVAEALKKSVGG